MTIDHAWRDNLEFVDPELEPYLFDEDQASRSVKVLVRPRGDRSALAARLEAMNVESVDTIASQSLRAKLQTTKLEDLVTNNQVEAVELERPLRVFGSGN
ncbi:hypothetical protein JCM31271_26600 [Halorubrum trueperi]